MRLAEIWAAGEAGASLGFETSRLFDRLDPTEKAKDKAFAEQGVVGLKSQLTALRKVEKLAQEYLALEAMPASERGRRPVRDPGRLTPWCATR